MTINITQLSQIFPSTHGNILSLYVDPLNDTFTKFGINTSERIGMFIAQAGHESGYFNVVSENLNYSAQSLLAVFPSHFTSSTAAAYARQPEKIANHVYANRMGNGDEASGDGWLFRGRGLIQITGRATYNQFADAIGMSLTDTITFLQTPEGATQSAGWFWSSHGLNGLADQDMFTEITKRINGGVNGLADREAIWERARKVV